MSNIDNMALNADLPSVAFDSGSGRPFVFLYEHSSSMGVGRQLLQQLCVRSRVVAIATRDVDKMNWHELSKTVGRRISELGIRNTSLVGFGACASLVQNLYLESPKLVRTAVFVDAASRPHPTLLMRAADQIESFLPLGLPLRLGARGFDSMPFLHRIRCPILLITTGMATAYLRGQARQMSLKLPTAWWVDLSSTADELTQQQRMAELLFQFQDTPAKCPQKNAARGGRDDSRAIRKSNVRNR